jgi:UDP-glucose 4-epimerase
MKIVVTGGLGFIGVNLAAYMRRMAPASKLVCVDWNEGAPPLAARLYDTVHRCDFSAPELMPAYANADVVVHLAATTTVQESIRDPYRSFENNVIKTQLLLDMLRRVAPEAHFVFASTGGAIIGEHDGAINESLAPRPVSPYGATKLAVEGLLSAYTGSFGLRAASLRFSNVYGPWSTHKGSVVAAFCKAYLDDGHLVINGDGLQTRDYVYVGDICQAIFKTIQADATGPFQLGTGRATSILDLVEAFRALDPARPLRVSHRAGLSGEVKHNVCDIAHARTGLGYAPEYGLARGLAETVDWFRAASAPAPSITQENAA